MGGGEEEINEVLGGNMGDREVGKIKEREGKEGGDGRRIEVGQKLLRGEGEVVLTVEEGHVVWLTTQSEPVCRKDVE